MLMQKQHSIKLFKKSPGHGFRTTAKAFQSHPSLVLSRCTNSHPFLSLISIQRDKESISVSCSNSDSDDGLGFSYLGLLVDLKSATDRWPVYSLFEVMKDCFDRRPRSCYAR